MHRGQPIAYSHSQSRIATSSAAQDAKPEITSANSRALLSHVFFSQSALAIRVLLIGPSMSRAVLCEVRSERYIKAIRTAFVPVFGLKRKDCCGRVHLIQRPIVDRNGLLEETALLEEKAQCRCNNPRHWYSDGQHDFGDWHSG